MNAIAERIALLESELDSLRTIERRTDARSGYFVAADLDGFKAAQDAHERGHAFGDDVLREFGAFLESVSRSEPGRAADRVATRKGGDEFLVWCPTEAGAQAIADRVNEWRSALGNVSASAGIGRDLESADRAAYDFKISRKRAR